jgi:hypothetical protein
VQALKKTIGKKPSFQASLPAQVRDAGGMETFHMEKLSQGVTSWLSVNAFRLWPLNFLLVYLLNRI